MRLRRELLVFKEPLPASVLMEERASELALVSFAHRLLDPWKLVVIEELAAGTRTEAMLIGGNERVSVDVLAPSTCRAIVGIRSPSTVLRRWVEHEHISIDRVGLDEAEEIVALFKRAALSVAICGDGEPQWVVRTWLGVLV